MADSKTEPNEEQQKLKDAVKDVANALLKITNEPEKIQALLTVTIVGFMGLMDEIVKIDPREEIKKKALPYPLEKHEVEYLTLKFKFDASQYSILLLDFGLQGVPGVTPVAVRTVESALDHVERLLLQNRKSKEIYTVTDTSWITPYTVPENGIRARRDREFREAILYRHDLYQSLYTHLLPDITLHLHPIIVGYLERDIFDVVLSGN